ncbi:MAG: DUF4956 domain-containing protein [Bacteroidota bacterium]
MTITELLLQVNVVGKAADWAVLQVIALKFLFNLLVVFLTVKLGYMRSKDKPEFAFTYFIFNVLIFFLCFLMTQVDLSLGFAFGLFALFSIMRYRTMTIEIREMTYLFVVVSLGVLNSVTDAGIPIIELVIINLAILGTVLIAEHTFLKKSVKTTAIRYENIQLVNANRFDELKADLESRFGVEVLGIEILMLNYMTDSAELQVTYRPALNKTNDKTSSGQLQKAEIKTMPEEVHP